jgi:hypothetical protein
MPKDSLLNKDVKQSTVQTFLAMTNTVRKQLAALARLNAICLDGIRKLYCKVYNLRIIFVDGRRTLFLEFVIQCLVT